MMLTRGASAEALEEAPEIPPALPVQIFMPTANLPPLKVLVMDDNVATNWKAWKKVWSQH